MCHAQVLKLPIQKYPSIEADISFTLPTPSYFTLQTTAKNCQGSAKWSWRHLLERALNHKCYLCMVCVVCRWSPTTLVSCSNLLYISNLGCAYQLATRTEVLFKEDLIKKVLNVVDSYLLLCDGVSVWMELCICTTGIHVVDCISNLLIFNHADTHRSASTGLNKPESERSDDIEDVCMLFPQFKPWQNRFAFKPSLEQCNILCRFKSCLCR